MLFKRSISSPSPELPSLQKEGEKMKTKRIILTLVILSVIASCLTVGAGALTVGSGAAVVAAETNLIKTGLLGQRLGFSDTDFKAALGVADFGSITVTSVPSSSEGTLMLSGRRVSENQTIRRRSIAALSFIPASREVAESRFTFTVDELAGGAEIECIMKFISKINYKPKVNTDAEKTLSVTTQKGISVYGSMEGEDPEGDDVEYIIVSFPKNGLLDSKRGDGEFVYTPNTDYRGSDSFSYVLRDEYGNYSSVAKVNINVTERMSEVVYRDMLESKSYNAAVSMTAMGIMSGERIGDDMYFNPAKTVTRAEFVAMAMKALSIKADTSLDSTFFDDNDDIPASLVGYVATAQKKGIVNGSFDGAGLNFRPNDAITTYEAAIVMANLISTITDTSGIPVSNIEGIPVWAKDEISVMFELGIFDTGAASNVKEPLTREAAAECLWRLSLI